MPRLPLLSALALAVGTLLPGCGPSDSQTVPAPDVMAAPDWPPAVIPDQVPPSPAAGTVLWQRFQTDQARLGPRTLILRQGSRFSRFVEVRIEAGAADVLKPGTELKVTRDAREPPHIVLKSYDPGSSRAESATFADGYVMKLELGPAVGGKVAGKVFLAVPDAHQSVVAGTFVADDVRADPAAEALGDKDAPCVYGRVALRNAEGGSVEAAYSGTTLTGDRKSCAISIPFKPAGPAADTTFRPRVSQLEINADRSATFHHVTLDPGRYLVTVSWKGRVADWRWVSVTGGSTDRLDLTIDPTNVGQLEVALPAGLAKEPVRVVPADADGQVPIPETAVAANQKVEAKAMGGKAVFDGLAPGPYRVYVGTASLPARVQPKATTQVVFK